MRIHVQLLFSIRKFCIFPSDQSHSAPRNSGKDAFQVSEHFYFKAHGLGHKGWKTEKSQVYLAVSIPEHTCSRHLHRHKDENQPKSTVSVICRTRMICRTRSCALSHIAAAIWSCSCLKQRPLPPRASPGELSASSRSNHAVCLWYTFWELLSLLRNTLMC